MTGAGAAPVDFLSRLQNQCSLGWAVDQKLADATDLPSSIASTEKSLADGCDRWPCPGSASPRCR